MSIFLSPALDAHWALRASKLDAQVLMGKNNYFPFPRASIENARVWIISKWEEVGVVSGRGEFALRFISGTYEDDR